MTQVPKVIMAKANVELLYHLLQWGTPEEKARAYFESLHGVQPERVILTGGGVLVGPIPQGPKNGG